MLPVGGGARVAALPSLDLCDAVIRNTNLHWGKLARLPLRARALEHHSTVYQVSVRRVTISRTVICYLALMRNQFRPRGPREPSAHSGPLHTSVPNITDRDRT